MNRRSFLKAIGIAPMAAPVIARAEAQKASVSLSGEHLVGGGYYGTPEVSTNAASYRDRLLDRIKDVFSKSFRDKTAGKFTSWPTRLDPDLASSRSLSLSAALRIQRERNIDMAVSREKAEILDVYKREFGLEWMP